MNAYLKNKNLDLSILDSLSPAEKELALSILDEYSKEGKSKKLDALILEDYNEIPVDILTFVDDYHYLGNAWHDSEGKSKLYPYWRKELVKIFPDNLTTNVNNLILTGSRGRGKSEISILIAAYLLHRILCLKDPIAYFHLKPTEKIVFAFMNIKKDLAEEIGNTKFQNTIQSSPWFLAHGTLEGRTRKLWVPQKFKDQEAIDIKIGSQADDLIGLPIYFCFFDEVSFQRNQDIEKQKKKAYDMIDTAIGGMKTRFVHRGKNPTLLVLASSKRSDKSFLEEHMKKKLISEKENVYISDGSVWEVKPPGTYSDKTFKVALGNKFLDSVIIPDDASVDAYIAKGYSKIIDVPIDFKPDFIDDIDRALCDFAGISASSISKYINGAAVMEIITDRIQNPFSREILEIGDGPDDDVQYYNFFDISKIDPQLRSKPLFIHIDMSYTGDMTGIAGVFIRGKKLSIGDLDQSKDLFYSLAFSVSIKAPKGRHISFEKNRNFIYWLKSKGFNIKGITSDTYQSYDTGETLRAKGYPYSVLSVDRVDPNSKVCIPYQYLKSTIYEKRLEMYNDKMLVRQLIDLERNINNGKVDHPDGGCFTGETKVRLVDGRSLSFLELVDEYNSGKVNYVYSMNLNTYKIEPKPILKAWKTLVNQPLVKLIFDNGESVECTLNHRFMLRTGSYIEAQDLLPGDSLMTIPDWIINKSDLHKKINEVDNYNNTIKLKALLFIDKTADVYDIEVADNHNFVLNAGMFVHNSKDVCDALCGSIFNASKHAEQFAYEYGESAEQLLQINTSDDYDDIKQLTLSMEEELKKINGILAPNRVHPSDAEKKTDNYSLYDDIIIL